MKRLPKDQARKAGFTLLEISLVMTIAAIVVFKVAVVLGGATRSINAQIEQVAVEERARIVLDRIAYQLMGAERETLTPLNTPNMHVEGVRYRISLGVENGETIYTEEEEVRFMGSENSNEVVWGERIGTGEERKIIWTRLVQGLLEGEVANGIDDNGNGLTDEEGLVFVIKDKHVEIRLTLADIDSEGRLSQFTGWRYVTLRN